MKRRAFLSRILSMFAAAPAVAILPSAPQASPRGIDRTAHPHWRGQQRGGFTPDELKRIADSVLDWHMRRRA